ncbi:uncharacterized protein LOC106754651 isoform X1 [Vigna radiata var. radiata]|uniref:Uncharacterized protein LOC106754651 isoform X1 n=2 Tax=Vigna radiata var. radiata TaxID=3916 RepID=A0A1S3TEL6_VIGRR|nr:uncharacterized protein LOC106754651 isoform X1 [Vigna radiata var. radiata]
MDLPPEIDCYIKQSIDHIVGLPVSDQTLLTKLQASEELRRQLRQQSLFLLTKLKEKDDLIELARNEATMNAQAMKRFVEENQKLAAECERLVEQCVKLERECALYDHDREALMEFGNEADERAQVVHARACELERDLCLLERQLNEYKHQNESVDSSSRTLDEEKLLDSLLATVTTADESSTFAFLNSNSENDQCKKLLTTWNCLKPSTQRVLGLVAEVKSLENDKENLRVNLHRAEDEVKLLFEENSVLRNENKRLAKRCMERSHSGSDRKHGHSHTGSASVKSNKRNSSRKTSSPMRRKIDFEDIDSARTPLSPLGNKLPELQHE